MVIKTRAVNEKQKKERFMMILNTAHELFCKNTYEKVSILNIAKKAGIAKGTVFLYFKTKEELFLTLTGLEFQKWFDSLDEKLKLIIKSKKNISIDEFIDVLGASLGKNNVLIRLIAILHIKLEQNIDISAARQFKLMMHKRLETTGALLEDCLHIKEKGRGLKLLLWAYAVIIGFKHLSEPAPVMQEVISEPGMENLKVDFLSGIKEVLKILFKEFKDK